MADGPALYRALGMCRYYIQFDGALGAGRGEITAAKFFLDSS